jgi:hypothetical protein
MAAYFFMMFATALIQSELIMGLGMLLTLMLRDGKIAIYISFSLLASGSLLLYYNIIYGGHLNSWIPHLGLNEVHY